MCFRIPHLCSKLPKNTMDRWIIVYTVCAPAMISPLRQWLDFYAKTRLKMCHTFKHFVHMQYLLLTTPKVLLLCRSWEACVPRRSKRLCQLEF